MTHHTAAVKLHWCRCVANTIVTACQGELPLRSCFSLWTSLDGQGENATLSSRVVQTPCKITAAMAFCQALEHALRSPPVALRSRRSDAVGSWEVFESYMHHTLRTSPCQSRVQMNLCLHLPARVMTNLNISSSFSQIASELEPRRGIRMADFLRCLTSGPAICTSGTWLTEGVLGFRGKAKVWIRGSPWNDPQPKYK